MGEPYEIIVFLFAVFTIVIIVGSLMFVMEGPTAGFRNIPVSMYWAIVTLTTAGYGDIAPQTPLGQALAAFLMITGTGLSPCRFYASRKNYSRCPSFNRFVSR